LNATSNPIDTALYHSLSRLHRAYDGLLGVRSVTMPLPSKMPLTVEMGDHLTPAIKDVYWYPLRNGLSEAPENPEDLRDWLHRQLRNAVTWAVILALLMRYYRRSANYGGEIALRRLGLDGTFNLTDPVSLDMLDARATMLTTPDSEINLIDTTVSDLASAIPAARTAGDSVLTALGAYIAGRALTRAVGIAAYESPWAFNQGLGMTYRNNGIVTMMYDVNGVGCPEICAPLHGQTFPANAVPAGMNPPIHSGCDCVHSPVTEGWSQPEMIWLGG